MRKSAVVAICLLVLINTAAIVYFFCVPKSGVVYCDSEKLFNSFKLKIDLQKKLEHETHPLQANLDSLAKAIEHLGSLSMGAKEKTLVNELVSAYNAKKAFLGEQKQRLTDKYDQQIWSQLNSYVKDYGDQHQLDLIIGNNSVGQVVYHADKIDRTDAIIDFVNAKYVQD